MTDEKKRPLLYILIFVFSFIFFLYLTFPYGVLKESIVAEIAKATGYQVRIAEFGPSLPLGFECEDVTIISSDGSQTVKMKEIEVHISLLSLLIGRVSVSADLISQNKGNLDLSASWGIFQLALDNNFIPSSVELDAENFEIGSLVTFGIKIYAKNANDLIKGTISKVKVQGNLEGTVDLDLAVDDPVQSSGKIDLKIEKGILDLNDENLGVSKQKFKKAVVQASLTKGSLKISNKSGFHTQELTVNLTGNTSLRNPLPNSKLNLGLDVKLAGKLKDNFDFVLNMAGGKDGGVKYNLSGTLGRPNFRTR